MIENIQLNSTVKVASGKFAGAVGTVVEKEAEPARLLLRIAGILKGEVIDEERWFNLGQIEGYQGGKDGA
jgi:hypothetical protein